MGTVAFKCPNCGGPLAFDASKQKFYEDIGATVKELSFESNPPKKQVALMRCKHCIKYGLNMCKSPKNLVLRDEFNNIYPLKFNCKECEMEVLSPIKQ